MRRFHDRLESGKLPAMKIFTYIFLFIFSVAMAYSFFSKWIRVGEINFSTQGFWIKEEEKKQLISDLKKETEPLIGSWIWQVSIKKIQQKIQQNPKVEEVQILRLWPNKFQIRLLSDEPLLLWMKNNKIFYPITKKGSLMSPIPLSSLPNLPILRGKVLFENQSLRQKAIRIYQYLPERGLFSQKNISEITYLDKDSSFYIHLEGWGSKIRIGENLSEFRPDRVESVLRYLKQKKIKWRVIDARYSQKVVVSLVKSN